MYFLGGVEIRIRAGFGRDSGGILNGIGAGFRIIKTIVRGIWAGFRRDSKLQDYRNRRGVRDSGGILTGFGIIISGGGRDLGGICAGFARDLKIIIRNSAIFCTPPEFNVQNRRCV